MEAEGEMDSNESTANTYLHGEVPEGSEDGEVKREDSTLLERSLSAGSVSRTYESQGKHNVDIINLNYHYLFMGTVLKASMGLSF